MAFTLKKKEHAAVGLRRIACEEIDEALGHVELGKSDPEKSVHELRKHFKKLRAILG